MIFGKKQSVVPSAVSEVDVAQALRLNEQGGLLLDVREPNEFAEIHAPNSTLIPLGKLGASLNELTVDKDQNIAVICRSGVRSAIAAKLLRDAGYSQVSNIKGGIIAWVRAGLPVIQR